MKRLFEFVDFEETAAMRFEKEITTEAERVRIVCHRTNSYNAWCAGCGTNCEFITPLKATALSGQSLERVIELISIGVIHDFITPAQTFWVCLNSLQRICEHFPGNQNY